MKPIRDLSEARQANAAAGYYWFSPDTMKFFRTRVSESSFTPVADGTLFVTSDRSPHGAGWTRVYTVRFISAAPENRGQVDTVGEFGDYASLSGARAAVARHAAEWAAIGGLAGMNAALHAV